MSSLLDEVLERVAAERAAGAMRRRFAAEPNPVAAGVVGDGVVQFRGQLYNALGGLGEEGDVVAVANVGRPGAAVYGPVGGGGARAVAAASAPSAAPAGSVSAHALSGTYHTGMLADAQAPQFLKMDGTRPLTGNLAVDSGVTVDGVDVSAHAADPNAHHAQVHLLASDVGLEPDHSISGGVVGHVLRVNGASSAALAQLQHADLGGVTADQHHAKVHLLASNAGLGPDHSITGGVAGHVLRVSGASSAALAQLQHADLGGVTSDQHHAKLHSVVDATHHAAGGGSLYDVFWQSPAGTLSWATSSDDVSGGSGVRVLRSTSGGGLTVATLGAGKHVSTPKVIAAGDLALDPAGDVVVAASSTTRSASYQSQAAGWGITYAGAGDFRYLFADEMHVKSFIADLEQALAGGQIIAKSVAVLYAQFTAPAAGGVTTLTVRDLPSATGMAVFQNGDYARLRNFSRSGGQLNVSDCWGTVALDTTYGSGGFDAATKTQRYTYTRSAGTIGGANAPGAMAAGATVEPDSLVLDYGTSGNGYYEVSAVDGLNAVNSPYLQFVTWATHPNTGQAVRTRLGNLRGLTSQAGEYGLFAGAGLLDADTYVRVSSHATRFNNVDSQWWSGGSKVISIDAASGVVVNTSGSGYSSLRAYTFLAGARDLGGMYAYTAGGADYLGVRVSGGMTETESKRIEVAAQNYGSPAPIVQILARNATSDKYSRIDVTGGSDGSVSIYSDGSGSGSGDAFQVWPSARFYGNVRVAQPLGDSFLAVHTVKGTRSGLRLSDEDGNWGIQIASGGGVSLANTLSVPGALTAQAGATVTGAVSVSSTVWAGGQVRVAAGSAGLPSFSFEADGNSGMYSYANGTLGFSSDGVLCFRMSGTYNVSDVPLNVVANGNLLTLTGTDHGFISFYPRGGGAGRKAYMGHPAAGATQFNMINEDTGAMLFSTNGNAAQLFLAAAGNVAIGNSTASEKLHVSGKVLSTALDVTTDPGSGVAGRVSIVNASNWTIGSGVGSVRMSGSTARTNAAWLKVYIGSSAAWIPVWTNIS